MESLVKIFEYQGSNITFKYPNGIAYVNATQMAKRFGKQPKDYLKTLIAKDLIQAISTRTNILVNDLVYIVNGGLTPGTWLHGDIALDFAQWLSIDFRLWCNDRIKELLTIGMAATPETLESLLTNPDLIIGLANQLKTERAEKERLLEENAFANHTIAIQAPKVTYFNEVIYDETCMPIKVIALELGMTSEKLNIALRDRRIQYKKAGRWFLYAPYISLGYAQNHTGINNGHSYNQLVWTQKGRAFIHSILNPVMIDAIQQKQQIINQKKP